VTTRLRASRDYSHDVTDFAVALADPEFHRARLDAGGGGEVERHRVTGTPDDGTVEVVVRQPVPAGQVPPALGRLLTGGLVLRRTERWRLDARRCEGRVEVAPGRLSRVIVALCMIHGLCMATFAMFSRNVSSSRVITATSAAAARLTATMLRRSSLDATRTSRLSVAKTTGMTTMRVPCRAAATRVAVGLHASQFAAFTLPFNLSGQPAISLPLHWNGAGLPIGVQLVAAYGREDVLIRVAAELEAAAPWAARRPPLHAAG